MFDLTVTVLYAMFIVAATAAAILLMIFDRVNGSITVKYAEVMGIISSLLVFVQWAPQIVNTIVIKVRRFILLLVSSSKRLRNQF